MFPLYIARTRNQIGSQKLAGSALIDDVVAAQLVKNPGTVVSPKGVGVASTAPYRLEWVDMGWVRVKVCVSEGSGRPKNTSQKGGMHQVRTTCKVQGKRIDKCRTFWPEAEVKDRDAYLVEFVRICGVPHTRDFARHLFTIKGDDHCIRSEISAQKRAARKGISYDMPDGWFRKLYFDQGGICALSRLPMYRITGRLCPFMPVPDRIDCSLGYQPGNVRLLRHGINMMRRDMTDEFFISMCKSVANAT